MKWTNSVLDILKKQFGEEPFLFDDAVKTLLKNTQYSNVAMRQALHQLFKEGYLVRTGRGIYQIHGTQLSLKANAGLPNSTAVTFASSALLEAEKILKEKGIEYMITGPSALTSFHHHFARRLIHLIYVVGGAGEYAVASLRENDFRAFFNPARKQIDVVLEALNEVDIFIIREYAELEGNVDGRATIERAIVDTYFEATRRRIPFSETEVGRIIANAFRVERIDISRLLRFASRRGIRNEMESIVKELFPSLQLRGTIVNESARNVIAGIRS